MNNRVLIGSAPVLICLVVADLLLLTLVNQWSDGRIVDVIFINIAFLSFIISGLIVQKGVNSNLFSLTNTSIVFSYLIAEIVIGSLLIIIDLGLVWSLTIQIVLFLLVLIIFIMNLRVNKESEEQDENNRRGREKVAIIRETMREAFEVVNDREIKKVVEKAYDKSCSIAGYGQMTESELDDVDDDLVTISNEILSSAKSGDYDSVRTLCEEFMNLCYNRSIIVKRNQNR